ncbi:hypothetical protein AMS68_006840 [Peltaster fructicola]|uniref:Serine aminopeptidase S33 domain-containing protein n=1 Tax=Peltaster fructicola TaxID=286661 RepID=A0A6H0Y2S7_9PEZI|nr:hypothetical protein AMS68_006840 [Peltaster fructicola]
MKITPILATLIASVTAVDRITFDSNGTQIVVYHWQLSCNAASSRWGRFDRGRPATKAPVIVMGHGFAALQTSKLQPYAERFAAAGYHATTFDYRHWGQSDGVPRNIVDISLQQADFMAAVAAAKKLQGVDASRIVIWGSSLSGGTVLSLGPAFYNDTSSGVVGVISQVPHTNGLATAALTPQQTIPDLVKLSLADMERAKTDHPHICAYEGYLSIQPNPPGPEYSNFSARFIVQLPSFSPDVTAAQSHLPTYLGIGSADNVVSAPAAAKLAARMPNATTYEYEGVGHFDVYPGALAYMENLENQVAFLHKFVPLHKSF